MQENLLRLYDAIQKKMFAKKNSHEDGHFETLPKQKTDIKLIISCLVGFEFQAILLFFQQIHTIQND